MGCIKVNVSRICEIPKLYIPLLVEEGFLYVSYNGTTVKLLVKII